MSNRVRDQIGDEYDSLEDVSKHRARQRDTKNARSIARREGGRPVGVDRGGRGDRRAAAALARGLRGRKLDSGAGGFYVMGDDD